MKDSGEIRFMVASDVTAGVESYSSTEGVLEGRRSQQSGL